MGFYGQISIAVAKQVNVLKSILAESLRSGAFPVPTNSSALPGAKLIIIDILTCILFIDLEG